MLGRKLFVSVTDAAGAFTARGMVSQSGAKEVLDDFLATPQTGRAMFSVLSGHDGRIELRHAPEGKLRARIIARNRRERMLWGLLPAQEPILWEPDAIYHDDAQRLVQMIYTLPRQGFELRVCEEIAR